MRIYFLYHVETFSIVESDRLFIKTYQEGELLWKIVHFKKHYHLYSHFFT